MQLLISLSTVLIQPNIIDKQRESSRLSKERKGDCKAFLCLWMLFQGVPRSQMDQNYSKVILLVFHDAFPLLLD